ncbi:MAG TPA: hypothetical protein VIJ66_05295 [Solirubrobacteraceae bacterium]
MSNILTSRSARIAAIAAFTLLAAAALSSTPALAAAGEGCPNEQLRNESNVNPATGKPYSVGLPECRAYEMVSPLYKQAHDAVLVPSVPVAPDGDAVGFASLGAFAGFEGLSGQRGDQYLSLRAGSGWLTQYLFPPPSVIGVAAEPTAGGLDYSPDLSREISCGQPATSHALQEPAVICAVREPDGSWIATPEYRDLAPKGDATDIAFSHGIGSSRDLSHVIFQVDPVTHLLTTDTNHSGGGGSIYEIVGVGTAAPVLRLVNIDDSGSVIGPENNTSIGTGTPASTADEGSDYHAISEDGSKVFFTATPAGGVRTVYARVELPGERYETVALSNPSPAQCTTCSTTAQQATYHGASANGEKVFFTTTQQLLNADTDTTTDLYEYNFENERIVRVSGGGAGDLTPGEGAEVQGVVNVSSDGSHVYFVARGLLTTLANASGQKAQSGADNMYVFDTLTGETKFFAQLCSGPEASGGHTGYTGCGPNLNAYEEQTKVAGKFVVPVNDLALWNPGAGESSSYPAQTTPDGRYLVFTTYAKLAPQDTDEAKDVYRYDSQTGELALVSHGAPGDPTAGNADLNATLAPQKDVVTEFGDHADVGDLARQVSENGEDIVFETAESLQADDTNTGSEPRCGGAVGASGCDAYLWHDGTVSLISDGQDPEGADQARSLLVGTSVPQISPSGSDVFFTTDTQLVGQDTDQLADVYDARINGGFPAPTPESSCSGEACQGTASALPAFGAPGSLTFTGGGNLTPGSTSFPPPAEKGKVAGPSLKITKVKLRGNSLLVTLKSSAKGRVRLSGKGLVTKSVKSLAPGTHTIRVRLTKAGIAMRKHRKRAKVRVSLTVGKRSTASTKGVKL